MSTPLGYVQVTDDEVGQIQDLSGSCRQLPVDERERRIAVSRDQEVVPCTSWCISVRGDCVYMEMDTADR
jgi:hypothetical protein